MSHRHNSLIHSRRRKKLNIDISIFGVYINAPKIDIGSQIYFIFNLARGKNQVFLWSDDWSFLNHNVL